MMGETGAVRLDRWLVAARMYKTRPLAQEACEGGHVKLNGRPADSAKAVRVGDQVEAPGPLGPRVWRVLMLEVRRGPAVHARTLYDDQSPPPVPQAEPAFLRDRGAGRPSKRDARALRRVKLGEDA